MVQTIFARRMVRGVTPRGSGEKQEHYERMRGMTIALRFQGFLFCFLILAGCAYPRRSTVLTEAPAPYVERAQAPENLWALTFVSGQVPPTARGGLAWDKAGGLPDPEVRLYVNDVLIFTTNPVADTLTPRFDAVLPSNLPIAPDDLVRIEMWDSEQVRDSPIGIYRGRGLPDTAVVGVDATVRLEGGATVVLRVGKPKAFKGVGVALFEVRPDALLLVDVLPLSPAGRAGLRSGDRVVAIGGARVKDLGEARSVSALSMAVDQRAPVEVQSRDGQTRELTLDDGPVWLTMSDVE